MYDITTFVIHMWPFKLNRKIQFFNICLFVLVDNNLIFENNFSYINILERTQK